MTPEQDSRQIQEPSFQPTLWPRSITGLAPTPTAQEIREYSYNNLYGHKGSKENGNENNNIRLKKDVGIINKSFYDKFIDFVNKLSHSKRTK